MGHFLCLPIFSLIPVSTLELWTKSKQYSFNCKGTNLLQNIYVQGKFLRLVLKQEFRLLFWENVNQYLCACVCACVPVCARTFVLTFVCAHVCSYVCMHLSAHLCVYMCAQCNGLGRIRWCIQMFITFTN